jgi:hypothetical protein
MAIAITRSEPRVFFPSYKRELIHATIFIKKDNQEGGGILFFGLAAMVNPQLLTDVPPD